jgi:hypothetical protein
MRKSQPEEPRLTTITPEDRRGVGGGFIEGHILLAKSRLAALFADVGFAAACSEGER